MNILPNKLILLDDNLKDIGSISRVDSVTIINQQKLAERHYDNFLVAHSDVIADALREALIIDADSTLFYLGKPLSIDALFAEVERESRSFKRFVVVEDKLFRNQQARREVLGQILDYAKALQETSFDNFSDELAAEYHDWLDENEDSITRALLDANFLLLICGDRIQPRLVDYVKHLRNKLSPLISIELALLSLALFTDGKQHLLIPYVVALVTTESGITISVAVKDVNGQRVPATVTVKKESTPVKRRGDKINLDALLEAIKLNRGADSASVAQALIDHSIKLGGDLNFGRNNCAVRVKDIESGHYSTVFLISRQGAFRIHFLDRWTPNAGIDPHVADGYERRLASIFGKSATLKGTSAISLTEVSNHFEDVSAEIRTAIKALRHEN